MIHLKELLDAQLLRFNTKSFIENDPVRFAWRYTLRQDIEIVALLSALFAWGRRDMILRNLESLFQQMGASPFDYVMSCQLEGVMAQKSLHRTFMNSDLDFICRGLRAHYHKNDSLESFFVDQPDLFDGITALRTALIEANKGRDMRTVKHLAQPESQSACKRMHLFLRWLVRSDKIVDLGIWTNIQPASLYIPLDTHVGRIARELQIITRQQNDRRTVIELTNYLRQLDPLDPIKYDLALFGIGVD